MAEKKLAFPNPPNIMSFKIGINFLAYTEFAVTWEIVKFQTDLWPPAPDLWPPRKSCDKLISKSVDVEDEDSGEVLEGLLLLWMITS